LQLCKNIFFFIWEGSNLADNAIDRAISIVGGIGPLSKTSGIDYRTIYCCAKKGRPISTRLAREIEFATNGKVKASELRPDVFDGYALINPALFKLPPPPIRRWSVHPRKTHKKQSDASTTET
jgi:DNA-binding transcriptional regulator YdaS (Cro superfamily)